MDKINVNFIQDIKNLIHSARRNVIYAVNSEMVKTYYEIGKRIVEEEQKGSSRAGYGAKLIENLSKELTQEFGRGFDKSNLSRMRGFYLAYPILATVSQQLSWSHYVELIKIEDETKRRYFEKYAISDGLSIRDLKRQIHSLHYERLLMSKDKKTLLAYEKKGNLPAKSDDVVKDPYILEFLGMDEKSSYSEKDLESRILDCLQKFLLELGQGFTFVARQKRFNIDNDNFYIDLLFYNIHLRCYLVIDLKIEKFRHEDVGQMNFYLNYVKKELNSNGDADPIGIILCTEKDKVQVEFATTGISNRIFVSKYRLYLPTKEELENEIKRLL